jgi:hypothetical protein
VGILQKLSALFRADQADAGKDPDKDLAAYESDLRWLGLIAIGEEYKPADIKQFRESARNGDPRQLYELYDEMLRLGPGPQKSKALEAMKGASVQFKTFPEEFDDDDSIPDGADPQAVADARAARDFLQDTLSEWMTDLIGYHAEQDFVGIADSRIRLLPRGNAGRYDSIEDVIPIPARRHRLDTNTAYGAEWLLVTQPGGYNGIPIRDIRLRSDRGTEGVLFTEIGEGSAHLDQRGLLFQCLVPWAIQQVTARWRAKWIELYGVPIRMGFVDFSNKKRKADMYAMLKSMGSTAFGLVDRSPANQTEDMKLLESSNASGASDPFERQLEWCGQLYSEIILGHNQGVGVAKGAGSKTSADTAENQFKNLINSRLQTQAGQFRRGLGRPLVARNLGPRIATLHNPVMKLQYRDRDDPEMLATVAKLLKEAGAGGVIASEDLVRRCTLRLASGDEKTLGEAVPAPGVVPSLPAQALAARPARVRNLETSALQWSGGAGDEITGPALELIDRACAEDWAPNQILAEMLKIGNIPMNAPKLKDRLAGTWAAGIGAGVQDVQASRKKKVLN